MKHVNAVKSLLIDGNSDKAEEALDNLLELGPSNMEALKMKAEIFGKKGQLTEEAKTWIKIAEIDNEDDEAVDFLNRLQLEDRERYFFTEVVKENGRRFFAYPKNLFQISFAGLIGCISFLYLSTSSQFDSTKPKENVVLLSISFVILVILPWLSILYLYFKSLKTMTVSQGGIEICTRIKTLKYLWEELETVCITHDSIEKKPNVKLVLIPKKEENPKIEIDLNESTSSIKAKKLLISELELFCDFLSYDLEDNLAAKPNSAMCF